MDYKKQFLFFLAFFLFFVEFVFSTAGPVFINSETNPNAIKTQTAETGKTDFVTQTVYGFLDFTTTIGNTIMVFSPQSSALEPEPLQATKTMEAAIIETKPPKESNVVLITPTKTTILPENESSKPNLGTKTNEAESGPKKTVISKVEVVEGSTKKPEIVTKVEILTQTQQKALSTKLVEEKPENTTKIIMEDSQKPVLVVGNNLAELEYDFLSRQPSEVVEETYKVVNLKPSSKFHLKPRTASTKHHQHQHGHPTGLVTTLGGTIIKDGTTTVHETSVIGTYISGKYAQVLQSTSHLVKNGGGGQNGRINPSGSLRILKTAAPKKVGNARLSLEPTPSFGNEESTVFHAGNHHNSKQSGKRKASKSGGNSGFKNRYKSNRSKEDAVNAEEEDSDNDENTGGGYKKVSSPQNHGGRRNQNGGRNNQVKHHTKPKYGGGQNNRKQQPKQQQQQQTRPVSVHPHSSYESPEATSTSITASATKQQRYQNRRNKQQRNNNGEGNNNNNGGGRRSTNGGGYKLRGASPQPSNVDLNPQQTTSLYKFKLNRTPGRWQYKTTPKPRVAIRKQGGGGSTGNTVPTNEENYNDQHSNGAIEDGRVTAVASSVINLSSVTEVSSDGAGNNNNGGGNVVTSPQSRSDDVDGLEGSESIASIIDNDDDDDDGSNENKLLDTPPPLETLKVEISTPPDFKDVYYEIATIKSPYTFQVGNVRNTRFITVTSTFEKSLASTSEPSRLSPSEPLTENILTSSNYPKDNNFLDSSISTLPPLYLAPSDVETPPLETITESFSTTQTMLKTHLLPIIRDNVTETSTLVQTYLVTRLVSATKTLPPMEAYHFVPSRILNEFNKNLDEAGSELHLELEYGDQNNNEETEMKKNFLKDLDVTKIGSDFEVSDLDRFKIRKPSEAGKKKILTPENQSSPNQLQQLSQEQLQQLAFLRLLNPQNAQIVTTSKPVLKVETLYESHVVPITNGLNTIRSTISKILGTVTKTDYEFGTSTLAPMVAPNFNPLFPQPLQQPQQQLVVTSSPVVQSTLVTQTDSKVLKITFGAKTAHTTIFSTKVVPTVVTSYVTTSVPALGGLGGLGGGLIQPSVAFPGYFPGAFPGYPFLG